MGARISIIKKGKRSLTGLFVLVQILAGHSQNLLLNGDFEDVNICTEYTAPCAPEAWISSSPGFSNFFNDANRAHSGTKCMAIEAGHSLKPYIRSFLRSELLCGLHKGKQYRLSFFIKSPNAILLDSVGYYFGDYDPLLERKPVHRLAPSAFLGATQQFRSDSNWQKVVISYTATGKEVYFMLAYFGINDVQGETGLYMMNTFQIFLDDISLVPADPNEELCSGWRERYDEIYDMNARHEFLKRAISYRRSGSAKAPELPLTRVFKIDTVLMPDILFETGKADLKENYLNLLDSFCRLQKGRSIDSLIIAGHTDDTGTDTLNIRLSQQRAGAVATYLRRCSYFSRASFIVRGWGRAQPVAPNDSPENRQRNRRVELILYYKE